LAAIVQVPVVTNMTVELDTVQTEVVSELKVTVSPELAVALTVIGLALKGSFGNAPKLIV
jgi:hypothetical protein